MNKTLSGLLGLAALALAAPVSAQDVTVPSGSYALDPTHATVTWSVKHMGLAPYIARFESFDMALELDVANPENSTITASINPASVSTPFPGAKDFDGEIAGPGFLDAAAFPTIDFVSTRVEPLEGATARVTGDLTMLGVTQEVTLLVELTGWIDQHPFAGKPAVGFHATGELDRTAFGSTNLTQEVGNGAAVVSPTVSFEISAEFVKAD